MFIIIVFDRVLTALLLFLHRIFTLLSQGMSRDVTLRFGVSINLKSASFRVLASAFWLLTEIHC